MEHKSFCQMSSIQTVVNISLTLKLFFFSKTILKQEILFKLSHDHIMHLSTLHFNKNIIMSVFPYMSTFSRRGQINQFYSLSTSGVLLLMSFMKWGSDGCVKFISLYFFLNVFLLKCLKVEITLGGRLVIRGIKPTVTVFVVSLLSGTVLISIYWVI